VELNGSKNTLTFCDMTKITAVKNYITGSSFKRNFCGENDAMARIS
jgi:hypothetical protein